VPILLRNARRIVSGLAKPQRDATRCNGVSLSSSRRLAASTRAISTKSAGVLWLGWRDVFHALDAHLVALVRVVLSTPHPAIMTETPECG